MAKLRYYAVRNGRKTGIFRHWEECKDQVVGFKDAEYKSFDNMKDAEEYLSQTFTEKERPAKKRRSKAEKIADYNTVAENLSSYKGISVYADKAEAKGGRVRIIVAKKV